MTTTAARSAGQRTRHPSPRGFVLVVVLILLVILSLLAAAVAASASRAVAETQQDLDRFQSELDMISTRETLIFMLSTQRLNLVGLSLDEAAATRFAQPDDPEAEELGVLPTGRDLRMDGTVYSGIGDTRFSIHDDRGLIDLNWTSPFLRGALYESLGVPAGIAAELDAKRLDYQDADSLHRLNGAEAEQYVNAGLPPPANRTVATPLELRRVLQLQSFLAPLSDEQLLGTLSTSRVAVLNINTAAAEVLALVPGMSPQDAQRMVDLRRQAPFVSIWQAQQSFPIPPLIQEDLVLFPKGSGNLILWDRRFGTRTLLHWTLTYNQAQGAPWRIDYEVTLPRGSESDQVVAETPATTLFTTADQARE